MTSAIRYSGPSTDDPDGTCPVCNKPMIITYTDKSRESGVAFNCPYWIRFEYLYDLECIRLFNVLILLKFPLMILSRALDMINRSSLIIANS
jgi:hypothetical protein